MLRLLPVESFHEELPYFAPDAVVLAGLHMLEREGEKFVRGRIGDVCHVLAIHTFTPLAGDPSQAYQHGRTSSLGDGFGRW